jgi:hypothetical protein
MPIRARASKSGEKKVFKRNRADAGAPLNRAARMTNRAEAGEVRPGASTEVFDQTAPRSQRTRQTAVIESRRRRH